MLAYQIELGMSMSVIVTMETDEDVTVVPDGLVPQTVDTEVAVAETVVVEVRVQVLDPSPQTPPRDRA